MRNYKICDLGSTIDEKFNPTISEEFAKVPISKFLKTLDLIF